MKPFTKKDLEGIDALRDQEGNSKNSHTTLADVVDQIKRGGMCLDLNQAFPSPGVD